MRVAYLDEAGDSGVFVPGGKLVTPVFVIACLAVPHNACDGLTRDFLRLKREFFPRQIHGAGPGRLPLDAMLVEVKGSDLRGKLRADARRERRPAIAFLHRVLDLLESRDVRLIGNVWTKRANAPCDVKAMYTRAVQSVFEHVQNLLDGEQDEGLVVIDARSKNFNVPVGHAIFTQRFRSTGNPYSRLIELPTFGHSANFAGLQLADVVASALVFPMAVSAYYPPDATHPHLHPRYAEVRRRFGVRIRDLQHRYKVDGFARGGLVVRDDFGGKPGSLLFEDSPTLWDVQN